MTTFPNSPRLIKSGIALLDPQSEQVQRVIVLQYSPDTLSRTRQVQVAGGEGGRRMGWRGCALRAVVVVGRRLGATNRAYAEARY